MIAFGRSRGAAAARLLVLILLLVAGGAWFLHRGGSGEGGRESPEEAKAPHAPAEGEAGDSEPEPEVPSWARVSREQIAAARASRLPVAVENRWGMRFVLIPGGEFLMGSSEEERARVESDPAVKNRAAMAKVIKGEALHRVRLTAPYYVQVAEVTNWQYRQWKSDHSSGDYKGHDLNQDRQPAARVSWQNAEAFASEVPPPKGLSNVRPIYMLPTEAEWEHACRAGTTSAYAWGDTVAEGAHHANGADAASKAGFRWPWPGWPREDRHVVSAPIGSYAPNPWGLMDMHGNVWEWCREAYGPYETTGLSIDPGTSGKFGDRVIRGGSWMSVPSFLRSAFRAGKAQDARFVDVGFRLVLYLVPR